MIKVQLRLSIWRLVKAVEGFQDSWSYFNEVSQIEILNTEMNQFEHQFELFGRLKKPFSRLDSLVKSINNLEPLPVS